MKFTHLFLSLVVASLVLSCSNDPGVTTHLGDSIRDDSPRSVTTSVATTGPVTLTPPSAVAKMNKLALPIASDLKVGVETAIFRFSAQASGTDAKVPLYAVSVIRNGVEGIAQIEVYTDPDFKNTAPDGNKAITGDGYIYTMKNGDLVYVQTTFKTSSMDANGTIVTSLPGVGSETVKAGS